MTQYNPLKTIFILTYVSLVVVFLVFVFSMFDLGYNALWTNLAMPSLTASYHITILVLHRRARKTSGSQPPGGLHPTSKKASLVCAYLLAVSWLVPLGTVSSLGIMNFVDGVSEYEGFPTGNLGTVIVQIILDATEVGIMLAVAIISTKMRRNATTWVPINEVSLTPTIKS